MLCYFGSLAQDIHHIVGGEANPHGPVVYVLTGTSLAFCAIAAIVATVYTKCASGLCIFRALFTGGCGLLILPQSTVSTLRAQSAQSAARGMSGRRRIHTEWP